MWLHLVLVPVHAAGGGVGQQGANERGIWGSRRPQRKWHNSLARCTPGSGALSCHTGQVFRSCLLARVLSASLPFPRGGRSLNSLPSTQQAKFSDFTALLPEAECRYAVYDFSYTGNEGVEKSKSMCCPRSFSLPPA